jgi:O-acetyl-ADP-ribose deacetylase (regulator of RNase III)
MILVKGDLLKLAEQGEFDIIVHGANCWCTMGSGVAKQIREQYPTAYAADATTSSGDYTKLGSYTLAVNDLKDPKFVIANAYTQYGFNRGGANEDVFEYASFALILQKFAYLYKDKRFGFPLIGMGLAGGDPVRIMTMLEDFSRIITEGGGSVTVVEFA